MPAQSLLPCVACTQAAGNRRGRIGISAASELKELPIVAGSDQAVARRIWLPGFCERQRIDGLLEMGLLSIAEHKSLLSGGQP